MHLALKVNRKVYSDGRLNKPKQREISGKRGRLFEAAAVGLTSRICARHTELIREVQQLNTFIFN